MKMVQDLTAVGLRPETASQRDLVTCKAETRFARVMFWNASRGVKTGISSLRCFDCSLSGNEISEFAASLVV